MNADEEQPVLLPLAQKVFDVLYGRKGFNWWWDGIDSNVQAEIIKELNRVVHEET